MSKRPRRKHGPAFKAKMASAAVNGEYTLAELAWRYDVHPDLINQRRARLLEGAADVFGAEPAAAEPAVDVTVLHAKIDELHLLHPFAGSRTPRDLLRQEGMAVGRLHVAMPMKRTGLEAIYRRPTTSKALLRSAKGPHRGTRSVPTCCANWR